MRVVNARVSGDQIVMRGTGFTQFCYPEVWLDGFRIANDGSVDSYILPPALRAIEVYSRPTGVPPQYLDTADCGTILLWSGPRELPGVLRR